MNILGGKSKTTILVMESHKLACEFTVATGQTLKTGQPVKLTTTGEITAWAKADGHAALLGYCYSESGAGGLVTVFVRGYSRQFAISSAATVAGLGSYQGYDTETSVGGVSGYNTYAAAASATEGHAHILTPAAGAGELIEVVLF